MAGTCEALLQLLQLLHLCCSVVQALQHGVCWRCLRLLLRLLLLLLLLQVRPDSCGLLQVLKMSMLAYVAAYVAAAKDSGASAKLQDAPCSKSVARL